MSTRPVDALLLLSPRPLFSLFSLLFLSSLLSPSLFFFLSLPWSSCPFRYGIRTSPIFRQAHPLPPTSLADSNLLPLQQPQPSFVASNPQTLPLQRSRRILP